MAKVKTKNGEVFELSEINASLVFNEKKVLVIETEREDKEKPFRKAYLAEPEKFREGVEEAPPEAEIQSKFTPLPFSLQRINAILRDHGKQLVIVYDVEDGEFFDAYVVDL